MYRREFFVLCTQNDAQRSMDYKGGLDRKQVDFPLCVTAPDMQHKVDISDIDISTKSDDLYTIEKKSMALSLYLE